MKIKLKSITVISLLLFVCSVWQSIHQLLVLMYGTKTVTVKTQIVAP